MVRESALCVSMSRDLSPSRATYNGAVSVRVRHYGRALRDRRNGRIAITFDIVEISIGTICMVR
jgi:hypothetical protein